MIEKLNVVTAPGQQRRAEIVGEAGGGSQLIGGSPELQPVDTGIKATDLIRGADAAAHLPVLQGFATGTEGVRVAAQAAVDHGIATSADVRVIGVRTPHDGGAACCAVHSHRACDVIGAGEIHDGGTAGTAHGDRVDVQQPLG